MRSPRWFRLARSSSGTCIGREEKSAFLGIKNHEEEGRNAWIMLLKNYLSHIGLQ